MNTKKELLLIDIENILKLENISNEEKQIKLELVINTPIDYIKYLKYFKQDKYILRIEEIRTKLFNIDFNKVIGKTFFKKFFKEINKDIYINIILIPFILRLVFEYISEFSISKISIILLEYLNKFCIQNNIKSNNLDLRRIANYTLEILKENLIIIYNLSFNKYFVSELIIDSYDGILGIGSLLEENCYFFYKKDNWPLLVPPRTYDNNTYLGGFYNKPVSILIENKFTKNLRLTEKGLDLLNKYQTQKYKLNKNNYIIELLYKYKAYLLKKIKENTEYKLNSSKETYILAGTETYSELYYVIIQYLILLQSNIEDIYFTYKIDFRGRIYNNISYGLNPTTNKLSRLLISFGLYDLTLEGKMYLKDYIFAKLNIKTEETFNLKIKELKYHLETNFINLTNEDFINIENIIILLDWILNVETNNKSGILIELDASQSGFQMLSLFSNDLSGLIDTNILKHDYIDLYTKIFNKLIYNIKTKDIKIEKNKFKYSLSENCVEILNRKYIKKIIMTIPYGSTVFGQQDMFLEIFNTEYGLINLFKKNTIPIILKSKILGYETTIKELESFLFEIENNYYLKEGYNDIILAYDKIILCQKLLEKDLKNNFIPLLLKEIKDIIYLEYSIILNFIDKLKNDINLNLNYYNNLETDYFIYSLNYYIEQEYKLQIKNTIYKYYVVDYNKINKRKIIQSSIANICHGLGDSFIIYKILDYLINMNINCYSIHDAILCKSIDVSLIKVYVQKAYQYIYNYIIKNNIFNFYNYDICYIFKSFNIFKIK